MHAILIMRIRSRLLALLIASVYLPANAGEVIDRIKRTRMITIAHRESSIPFSYVLQQTNKPAGYAIDLCLHIVESLRNRLKQPIEVNYLPVSPADRIAAITDGRAQLECGSTTNNAERRKAVAFTIPHYITGARYLVRANSGITELRDFEGRRLISTKGTTALKAINQANRERLLRVKVIEAPDHARAVEMVATGEADGFVMDDVLLYGLIANQPDPSKFKVVGKFLTIEALAIMLPKGDDEFKKIVDDEMKRLIATREAHALYARWFETPLPDSEGGNLRIAMNYLLKEFWRYPTDQVPDY
jgi:ABC-type amino acid transport substrate-binding protein